ncbi:hypothetical protein ABPG72_013220 [Tetrahymena utriculariae]
MINRCFLIKTIVNNNISYNLPDKKIKISLVDLQASKQTTSINYYHNYCGRTKIKGPTQVLFIQVKKQQKSIVLHIYINNKQQIAQDIQTILQLNNKKFAILGKRETQAVKLNRQIQRQPQFPDTSSSFFDLQSLGQQRYIIYFCTKQSLKRELIRVHLKIVALAFIKQEILEI